MEEVYDVETGELIDVKTQFRNHNNFKLNQFEKDTEVFEGVTMTVPDESMTVKEILEKFTRGVLPDIAKVAEYDEVENFDGFETENPVDITEVEAQLTEVNERLKFSASVSGKAKKSVATTTKEEEASDIEPEASEAEK